MPKSSGKNDTSSDPEKAGKSTKKGGTRDFWTAAELAIVIRVLLEEKKKGRQAESGWTSESYQRVMVALKEAGSERSTKQIKSLWTRVCHFHAT